MAVWQKYQQIVWQYCTNLGKFSWPWKCESFVRLAFPINAHAFKELTGSATSCIPGTWYTSPQPVSQNLFHNCEDLGTGLLRGPKLVTWEICSWRQSAVIANPCVLVAKPVLWTVPKCTNGLEPEITDVSGESENGDFNSQSQAWSFWWGQQCLCTSYLQFQW